MRVVQYARVSDPSTQDTDDKVSIQQQLADMRALCEREGWQNPQWLELPETPQAAADILRDQEQRHEADHAREGERGHADANCARRELQSGVGRRAHSADTSPIAGRFLSVREPDAAERPPDMPDLLLAGRPRGP